MCTLKHWLHTLFCVPKTHKKGSKACPILTLLSVFFLQQLTSLYMSIIIIFSFFLNSRNTNSRRIAILNIPFRADKQKVYLVKLNKPLLGRPAIDNLQLIQRIQAVMPTQNPTKAFPNLKTLSHMHFAHLAGSQSPCLKLLKKN